MNVPESYLDTLQPEYMAMTRIFGIPDRVWENADLICECTESGGLFHCTFSGQGHSASRSTPVPADATGDLLELHRRRAARRLCKQTLYDLCRELTGIRPPWGSMTGVRPTHLMLEALGQGLSPEEARARLIREFDISETKVALLSEVAEVQSALPAPDDSFIDVYVGIPFCTTRCTYCSFSSGELGNGKLVTPYLEALQKEMNACAELLRTAGKTLRAVYVGGGTPTALPEDSFLRFMDMLVTAFPGASEYTVEAGRPDTITAGKLRAIREAGVNRISINPQTMNDKTLKVIGRAHTVRQVIEAYELARAENFRHINMDVIAGLPGEDTDDFRRTMDGALLLKPESLTVHTLALKRTSALSLHNHPLPDGDMTSSMVDMGLETARALGMKPYYLYRQKYMAGNLENTGYALPGHACLYNVDIMEETTHILALGAGGISKRVFPEEGHIERAPNVSNIGQYIERVDEMIRRKTDLFGS